MFITLVVLVVLILALVNDFKRDPGEHKKAKLFNGAVILLLGAYFFYGIRMIGWLFRHWDQVLPRFYINIGIVPAAVNITLFVIQVAAAILMYVLLVKMIKRELWAKNAMLKLLPILVLTEAFNVFRSWTVNGKELDYQAIGIIVPIIILGSLALLVGNLYSRPFLKDYFTSTKQAA